MILIIVSPVRIAPANNIFYAKSGKSRSVAPSRLLIYEDSDKKQDLSYVLGSTSLTLVARVTRGTPRKVASDVVTIFQSNEDLTVIGSATGAITNSYGSSTLGSEDATGLEFSLSSGSKVATTSASNLEGASRSKDDNHQASSDEATS